MVEFTASWNASEPQYECPYNVISDRFGPPNPQNAILTSPPPHAMRMRVVLSAETKTTAGARRVRLCLDGSRIIGCSSKCLQCRHWRWLLALSTSGIADQPPGRAEIDVPATVSRHGGLVHKMP
jgi:hypothetical protein